ncbi:MAG: riboflavin biosynthesis protein RibF [Clostridia bacterium]|nr:riboflavin biosynthesis protein RibF [Clostridia bacterium]
MRIIEYKYPCGSLDEIRGCVVALGFFDGVHLGHRALICDTVRLAKDRGCPSAVLTFPSEGGIKSGISRIYPTDVKLSLIEGLGVDVCVLADFESVRDLSAEEFVGRVIVGSLGAEAALAGEDYRFGKGAGGDSDALVRLMRSYGKEAFIHRMESCTLDGKETRISATLIRDYLTRGDVIAAARLLGAPYKIVSRVMHGEGLGRKLGFPTVNTELPDSSMLRSGVYQTRIRVGERAYTALTNVGTCPTFGERRLHAESFIIDFDEQIYGERVEIEFLSFIREERSFASAEELISEVQRNIREVRGALSAEEGKNGR